MRELIVIKQAVVVATIAAATLATDFEDGSIVDGVTLSTGDRILIKDQADAAENGIYVVQASGAPIRAADSNGDSTERDGTEIRKRVLVPVTSGTYEGKWLVQIEDPIVIDTDDQTWVESIVPRILLENSLAGVIGGSDKSFWYAVHERIRFTKLSGYRNDGLHRG